MQHEYPSRGRSWIPSRLPRRASAILEGQHSTLRVPVVKVILFFSDYALRSFYSNPHFVGSVSLRARQGIRSGSEQRTRLFLLSEFPGKTNYSQKIHKGILEPDANCLSS